MDKYLNPLIKKFKENKDAGIAVGQKKYMKSKFEFLGLKTPVRKKILKEHFKTYGKPEKTKMNDYIKFLWNLPEREFQYTAVNLYENIAKQFVEEDISILEYMIENKSWWDSVDSIVRLEKTYFQKFPKLIPVHTERWINSDNFWFQRSALLFQLNFRDKMDKELMFRYILKVNDSDKFFVQKAIGWILRQYSKFNPEEVIEFVNTTKLAPLSKREALKIINK
ncbi:MAG: DNA alkylation repair protein [Bacteroidales bacterium]|nr:DNA alkylation repair protein [Bacteroidales bacterium]